MPDTAMLERLDDTIVAISSAPGIGAVGIVRLSGPGAIAIADPLVSLDEFPSLTAMRGSRRAAGEVLIDTDLGLPVAVYLFRAPRSYTRQDMVELHTIGSPAALDLIRSRAIERGAVDAEPGEFTARAFVSGAMNLAEAEAVAGVIRARTDTQLRASRRMMDGTLAKRITNARDELAELLALVEADIDFAEEPIEFITPRALGERLARIDKDLAALVSGSVSAERFDVLPQILLLGPPNVGKSSLMNRLSGTRRAICAAAAGTTRDVLAAPIEVGGGEAMLLDAAGVESSTIVPGCPADNISEKAHAMALATADRVDLVCVVVDVTTSPDKHILDTIGTLDVDRVVLAANKVDLLSTREARGVEQRLQALNLGPVCLTSALRETGISELRAAFGEALGSATSTTLGEAVLVSARQRTALSDAASALARAVTLAQAAGETIDCADTLAFELREALDALAAVTGDITTDDLLGQVFANFCIGK